MIRVRALGECVIEVGDHRVGPEAATLFALLLYLALQPGTHVARQTLVELLWPGADDARGRHCVRQALYKLRQLGAPLRSTPTHVALPARHVSTDFLELEPDGSAAAWARRPGAAPAEFLPGYAPEISPAFTAWLDRQRDRAHSHLRRALSAALVECRARQRWADVDAIARHCLRIDPLNEEATLSLAEATAMTGSKARALRIIDHYVGELGEDALALSLPAAVLRRRIAERLPRLRYAAADDAIFVGRDASVELLAGLFRHARAGAGRACLVWGAAGIGKSRLVAECARAAVLQGAQTARVACQTSDVRRPLSAFVDLVPILLALPGALGCSPTSMRYLGRLTDHDASATAPSEESRDAASVFASVRRSLFDLIDAIASEAMLVLIVEDVHWLDPVSWEVLREMIDWGAARRVLVLLTSREERPAGSVDRAPTLRLSRHHLGPLDDAAAATLLTARATEGGRAMGDELRSCCVAAAEGNPFFLDELARQWVETGDATRPPASLLTVLGDRLSRLHPRSLRVLQACALLGRHATLRHLEAVTQYSRHELLDSLEELEEARLLGARGDALRPRHALIVDEALRRLPESAGRLLHRGAALSLAAEIESTSSAATLWDCARHWRLAGEAGRVHPLVMSCAAHLMEMGLPVEASEIYRTALESCDRAAERRDLLRGLAGALMAASLWKQARDVIPPLLQARLAVDPLASVHCDEELDLLETDWRLHSPTRPLLTRALACVDDARADPGHRLRAACAALKLVDNVVDHAVARHVYAASVALTGRRGAPDVHGTLCELIYHSSYGDLARASHAADTLVAAERSGGTPASLVRALRYGCVPKMRLGDHRSVHDSALEALRIAERHRLAGLALGAADELAWLFLEVGDGGEARRWSLVSRSWLDLVEDSLKTQEVTHTYVRTLAACGESDAARREFPYRLDEILRLPSIRSRTAWLALAAHLARTDESFMCPSRIAEELEPLHARTRTVGGQDFHASSLALLLLTLGETKKAASLLAAYVGTHRRDRAELPEYLRRALVEVRPHADGGR